MVLSPLCLFSAEHKWLDLPSQSSDRACFYFKSTKWLCTFTFSNRASALLTKVINNSPAVCWVQGLGRLFRLSNVVIINWPSSCESRKTSKTCNNLGKKNELSRYMVWAGNITQCLPMMCEAQNSSTGEGDGEEKREKPCYLLLAYLL